MSNTISGSYGGCYQSGGNTCFKKISNGDSSFSKNTEDGSFADSLDTEKLEKEWKDKVIAMIKNGDTEPEFQIGSQVFTVREWDRFLEKFDAAEDSIKETIEEEIEARKASEQKEKTNDIDNTLHLSGVASSDIVSETSEEITDERIDVDNAFYTIKKGEDNTILVYDKATGYSYAFSEDFLSIQTDSKTGAQFLISDISYTSIVEAMKLTPELKMSIQQYRNGDAITEKALDSKFTLTTDAATGIQALHWKTGDIQSSIMLISDAGQKEKLEELANIYLTHYPNLVSDQRGAEIRAAQEVMGNARRTQNGILTITGNAITYDDNDDYGMNPSDFSHCWTYFFDMSMTDEEYMDFVNDLRDDMLAADAKTLENEKDFLEALSEHQQRKEEEEEAIRSEMLTSESMIAESAAESGEKELHILWTTQEGIFCRKAGQTTGYEWMLPFDSAEQYNAVSELLFSFDADNMPEDISEKEFWENCLSKEQA